MFDRLARVILLFTVAVSPFFMFSIFSWPRESLHDFAVMILILVVLLLWSLGRLVLQPCSFVANWFWVGGIAVLISAFISALQTVTPSRALGGEMGEWGTVFSLAVFLLVIVLTAMLFNDGTYRRRALLTITLAGAALWFGEIILTIFRLFHLFPNWVASAGFFSGSPSDLAYLGGLVIILSLILLEHYWANLTRRTLIFISVAFGLSLVGEVILARWSVWLALGLVGALLFIEPYVRSSLASVGRRVWRPTFLVLVVSIPLLVWGGPTGLLGTPLNNFSTWLGWSTVEVRPSWEATWQIVRGSLTDHFWFGSGSNHFAIDWQRYRSAQPVNATAYAETDFSTGAGTISTTAFGGGLVGVTAWILLLGLLLLALIRSGWQNLRARNSKRVVPGGPAEWWLLALPVVYLWSLAGASQVNFSFLLLTAFSAGLFLAWLGTIKLSPVWGDNRRRGKKVVSVIATISLVLSLLGGAWLVERFIAGVHLASGLNNFYANHDQAGSRTALAASLARAPLPRTYRTLAEVNLMAIQDLLATPGQTAEVVRTRFQDLASSAVDNARLAVKYDSEDYHNFLMLGAVYRALVPLGFPEANNFAAGAYQTAITLAPHIPTIYLERARLALVRKDTAGTAQWLTAALNEKPNSSQLWYELGWLRYQEGKDGEARDALSRSLAIDQYFSNARFFLALSYERSGNLSAALTEYEKVLNANPDRTDLQETVERLRNSLPLNHG